MKGKILALKLTGLVALACVGGVVVHTIENSYGPNWGMAAGTADGLLWGFVFYTLGFFHDWPEWPGGKGGGP